MSVKMTVHLDTKGVTRAMVKERAGAARGLHAGAEHVLGVSQPLVPLQTGVLQGTGAVDVDDSELAATIFYDTVYAARQHEEKTWRHDPGRQAEYLEQPFVAEAQTVRGLIAAAIRRELR